MEKRIAASGLFLQHYRYVDGVGVVVEFLGEANVDGGEDALKGGVDARGGKESSDCALVEDRAGSHLPCGEDGGAEFVGDAFDGELAHGVDGTGVRGDVVTDYGFEAVEGGGGMDAGLHVSVVVVLAGDVLPVVGEALAGRGVAKVDGGLAVEVGMGGEEVGSESDVAEVVLHAGETETWKGIWILSAVARAGMGVDSTWAST